MLNFDNLLSGATNVLNDFKKIQKQAQLHLNNAEIALKDKPEFAEALKEYDKAKKRVKDLEKELKNVNNNQ